MIRRPDSPSIVRQSLFALTALMLGLALYLDMPRLANADAARTRRRPQWQ